MEIDKKYKITKVCSKDEYRPAMEGVYITEDGYAVATNTFVLAKVPISFQEDEKAFANKIINPKLVEASQKQKTVLCIYELANGIGTIDQVFLEPFIEEKFPPCQEILDRTIQDCKVYSVLISAKNLYELSQALGSEQVYLSFQSNANKPILVSTNEDAIGVLMPARSLTKDVGLNMTEIERLKQIEEQERIEKEMMIKKSWTEEEEYVEVPDEEVFDYKEQEEKLTEEQDDGD